MNVIDYSFSRPPIATFTTNGIVGVIRYVAHDPAKRISKLEFDALRAAGLSVALVWEDAATSWQNGWQRGSSDGAEARRQAREIGFPDNRPIYAAYDSNVGPAQLILAAQYMEGFNTGSNTGPQGAYGTKLLLDDLFACGLIRVGWQTNARGWIGNGPDCVRASLFQRYGQTIPGVPGAYDVNDINQPDWGQTPAPYVKPTTPALPGVTKGLEVDRLEITIATDADGNGWAQTSIPWPKFRGASVQGSAPGRDHAYWPGEAHGNNTSDHVLISVTGAKPDDHVVVFINVAH